MRWLVITLLCCALAVADPPLGGVWYLEEVLQNGQSVCDPRWSVIWSLESNGAFGFSSTTAVEKRKSDGTTGLVTENLQLLGRWRMEGDRLRLSLSEVADPQFMELNFGPPVAPAEYSVALDSSSGRLRLLAPRRTLVFARHKRH